MAVFQGEIRLEGSNVTLEAELYDLKVTVCDFLGRLSSGTLVELYNGSQRLVLGLTNDEGRLTLIRMPPAYTYFVLATLAR